MLLKLLPQALYSKDATKLNEDIVRYRKKIYETFGVSDDSTVYDSGDEEFAAISGYLEKLERNNNKVLKIAKELIERRSYPLTHRVGMGAASAGSGSGLGAAIGAIFGSAILPGLGTAVGGIIGSGVGFLVGSIGATGYIMYHVYQPDTGSLNSEFVKDLKVAVKDKRLTEKELENFLEAMGKIINDLSKEIFAVTDSVIQERQR